MAASYAKKSIFIWGISMIFYLLGIAGIAGSIILFKDAPLESVIVCIGILRAYSILTGTNTGIMMDYARWCDINHKITGQFFYLIIMPGLAIILGLSALWYHISVLVPNVTGTSPYLLLCWAYPILLLCVAGIRYFLENKHREYWDIYVAISNLTPDDVALTITHQE